MPQQTARLELDGVIAPEHVSSILNGYVPRLPQDKWFIFHEDGWLYFHRAQSGSCIFQLRIEPGDGHFVAPYLLVNRDPAQYRTIDDNYDVELMAYLMDKYLLGRNPPFPTPGRFNRHHKAAHAEHVIGRVPPASGTGFINLNDI